MAPSMVKLGHQPNAYRPFEVPVIYQENRIENMKQMLDALQHLENVSNAVFNRISHQVEQHKSNLASVQQRTQQASSRVSSLIGRNQATSVFSPPTYPSLSAAGGDDNQKLDHKPLFDSTNVIRVDPVYHKLNPGVSSLRNVCHCCRSFFWRLFFCLSSWATVSESLHHHSCMFFLANQCSTNW